MARSRRQQIQSQGSKAKQGRRGGGGSNSVANFLKPHTGKQAGKIANAQAGTEYNPAIREGRQQAKGSRKREHDIGQWYDQLAADYADSQTAGNEAFKTAQDATAKQLAEASDRSKSELGELSAKDASFAALVGGPTNMSGLSKAAEAGSAAERSRAALQAPIAATQASFLASLGGRLTSARMKGIEARKEEGDRRQKILSDVAAARKEKGQAKVSNIEKLRQADRGYSVEKAEQRQKRKEAAIAAKQAAAQLQIDRESNAISAQTAASSARQAQERVGISRKNARTAARSQRATARHYHSEPKVGALTASEQRSIKSGKQNASATARSMFEAKKWPSWAALERAVAKESEVAPAEARAAVARLRAESEASEKAKARARLGHTHR